jgi:hypothetical protein
MNPHMPAVIHELSDPVSLEQAWKIEKAWRAAVTSPDWEFSVEPVA